MLLLLSSLRLLSVRNRFLYLTLTLRLNIYTTEWFLMLNRKRRSSKNNNLLYVGNQNVYSLTYARIFFKKLNYRYCRKCNSDKFEYV